MASNHPLYVAKVKSVLSGDTLVLSGIKDPSKERLLSLAFVSAPRMRKDGDEVNLPLYSLDVLAHPCDSPSLLSPGNISVI